MRSIFIPNVTWEKRHAIRRYLAFTAAVRRRYYYINADGLIIEYDFDDFIRNKNMLTKADRDFVFFKDHEYLLKSSFVYLHDDHQRDYLKLQVWRESLGYTIMAFRVIERLADKLNRSDVEVMVVDGFKRGQPYGDVAMMKTWNLRRMSPRVAFV